MKKENPKRKTFGQATTIHIYQEMNIQKEAAKFNTTSTADITTNMDSTMTATEATMTNMENTFTQKTINMRNMSRMDKAVTITGMGMAPLK